MTYIDAHTHLDHCKADAAELVAAARAAGVDTIIQSGTDAASSRLAVDLAERFPGVWATVGFHPHDAKELDEAGANAIAGLTSHPRVVAVGEAGLDYHYDHSPRERQLEVFEWHTRVAAEAGLPLVVHTREADEHTLDLLARSAGELTVVLHCFSMTDRLDEVLARGYYLSFAGNVTFPKATAIQAAARAVSADRLLLETDAPYLTPVPRRGRPNTPAMVAHTYAYVAALRGESPEALAAAVRANAARAFPRLRVGRPGVEEREPGDRTSSEVSLPAGPTAPLPAGLTAPSPARRQVSLARLAEFGLVPKRSLGQNFLVDDNIVGVILNRLEAGPGDVAIEVGAGLGILTRALAAVTAHVHAFEIDRTLAPALEATLADVPEGVVSLHYDDIMKASLEAIAPPPTVCASNLPYSVAAPFLGEALERLPGVRRYCVMTQREVADRLASPPGSKAYGALSVWVQLHARVVEIRPLSRSIFHPQPNVDSALVTLERRPADPLVEDRARLVRAVVEGAFAQRRKVALNSLASSLALDKDGLAAALERAGVSAGARAEALEPRAFVAVAAALVECGLDAGYNEHASARGGRGTGSMRKAGDR